MNLRIAAAIVLALAGTASSAGQEAWRAAVEKGEALRIRRQFAEAARVLEGAMEEARKLAPDPVPAAVTHAMLGALYLDEGQCDGAVRAYQDSVELWGKAGERGETYLLKTANLLVSAYLDCGDLEGAERHYRALVAPRVASRPARDRDANFAVALGNLGSIEFHKRRYAEALAHFEEAAAVRARLAETATTDDAVLLNNLSLTRRRMGDTERALAYSERAVALFESIAATPPQLLIEAWGNRAVLLAATKKWREAEALLERALTKAQEALGEEHPVTASVMAVYAGVLRQDHRKREAAALEARVREIRRALPTPGARQTVDVREMSLK
jgi:tetratricopeptide (TPR) repeat protein